MAENRQLRAAIIGCGVIASDHVATIKSRCGPVEVVLCDSNPSAAKSLSDRYRLNAEVHTDARGLLEEQRFDIVHVLTPPDSHHTLARLAIEAEAHVFVEKPMTLTLHETMDLIESAEQRQRLLCVGHSLLYMDCVRKAIAIIQSGTVGRVVTAHCFFGHAEKQRTIAYRGVSHWAYRLPGGPLVNLISHPASVLVEVLGRPQQITSVSQALNVMPYGYADLLNVAFMTDAGLGTFTVSMAHGNASRYLALECERGSIYIDLARQLVAVGVRKGKLSVLSKVFGGIGQGWSLIAGTIGVTCRVAVGKLKRNPGTRELVARFYQAVRSQGLSPVSRDNALGVAEIVQDVLITGNARGDVDRGGGTAAAQGVDTHGGR